MIGGKNRDTAIRRRAGASQRVVITILCFVLCVTLNSVRMSSLSQYLSPVTGEQDMFVPGHDVKETLIQTHSDKKGPNVTTYNLLVVIPGFGDSKHTGVVNRSLNAISSSLDSEGFGFTCIVYVWNATIVKQASDAFTQCSVTYSAGKWTHHMLKVPPPSKNITHVALLIDDIDVSSIDVASFLMIMSRAKYDQASAAAPQWHYAAMHQRHECISHRTDFADIIFSVFTAEAWLCFQSQIDLERNEYGWGYDVTFADQCKAAVGVIDSAIATHEEQCEYGGDCSRSYNSEEAADQLWRWIMFAKNFSTVRKAKAHWKYVSERRPSEFPTCDLVAPTTSSGDQDILRFRLVSDQFFKTVEHRGGWSSVIRYLVNSDGLLLNDEPADGEPVLLVDNAEDWFPLPRNGSVLTKPWIGITHRALAVPTSANQLGLERTLWSKRLKDSLPFCLGLVVLSNDNIEQVRKIVTEANNGKHVNICSMPHPIAVEESAVPYDPGHDLDAQISDGGVLMLGQQYRRVTTIYKLQTHRRKMWLPGSGSPDIWKELGDRYKDDLQSEGVQHSSVEMKYVSSHEEYDQLVKQNIVVIDLWAATANNAILEAIALNAPFFVRRLPSTVQYLGKGYPLLFSDFHDLQSMLDNGNALPGLLLSGHEYLKNMNKTDLSLANFATNLRSCVRNSSLLDLPK